MFWLKIIPSETLFRMILNFTFIYIYFCWWFSSVCYKDDWQIHAYIHNTVIPRKGTNDRTLLHIYLKVRW